MSYTVSFYTLGCRVNQYESDAIAEALERKGFCVLPFGEPTDVTVVNTCTVTAESDKKSRQAVRKAARSSPFGKVIVVGCSSQINSEPYEKINGVYYISGNNDKDMIAEIVSDLVLSGCGDCEKKINLTDTASLPYDKLYITHARRARAYVKIEDGCENKCAYCIIPKARGNVRSKAETDVISEITQIAQSCPEIILTGIETASYGRDRHEKNALAKLLCKVDKIDGVRRLTLGSLDPSVLTDSFLSTVASLDSFLPHLHISMQSGCTSILNRMRRKYTAESALERIEKTRGYIPEIMLSADVIVGFPGETDEEFENSVDFFKKARFTHLHIFPYSVRKGTEAEKLPGQVPDNVKRERCKRLSEIQARIKKEILEEYVEKYRSSGTDVLFEQQQNGINIGHSRHYVEVRVRCDRNLSDEIVDVCLTHSDGEVCYGELIRHEYK